MNTERSSRTTSRIDRIHRLDANALIDYLHGEGAVGEFVRARSADPFFSPTVALHEVFIGAARLRGVSGVVTAREDLDGVEPLPLTIDAGIEAALIDGELHGAGTPIGSLDTLIAGTVRSVGGSIVTRDGHFERVENLETRRYRSESDEARD